MRCAAIVAVLAVAAVGTVGCTAGSGPAAPSATRTIVQTRTAAAPSTTSFTPAPATSVVPLRPGRRVRAGEVEKACPYIKSGLSQTSGTGVNVAAIEGDHVYRTTVLSRLSPVGCRFYFYGPPYEAIADIEPRTFATALDAHNALVLTARAGTEPISEPDFVPGVDGIAYRTRFFGADGARDWAFAFAKGRVLVVVHTQQTNVSYNAVALGKAVVGKF